MKLRHAFVLQASHNSPSFVDQNPAFQDLSESFRSLYKSVFENNQGEWSCDQCLALIYQMQIAVYHRNMTFPTVNPELLFTSTTRQTSFKVFGAGTAATMALHETMYMCRWFL